MGDVRGVDDETLDGEEVVCVCGFGMNRIGSDRIGLMCGWIGRWPRRREGV